MNRCHCYLSMAIFLINRRHPYWWIAVVSWLSCLILAVDLWTPSAQHQVKKLIDSSAKLHTVVSNAARFYDSYTTLFSLRNSWGRYEREKEWVPPPYIYICIYRYWVWRVNYRLNYAKMKIAQTYHFIMYIHQNYMKNIELL